MNTRSFPKILLALAVAGVAASPLSLNAGDAHPPTVAAPAPQEESTFDKIWGLPVIYSNKDNRFLQEFRFVGRAQFDEYSVTSNPGWDQDWIVRRLRVGAKASFFNHLTAHVEVDLQPQNPGGTLYVADPVYQRLTDAYLSWKFNDALRLTVGKQGVKFTLDGNTSSNELITIDRNNLSNNIWFTTEYASGVSVNGKIGNFQYNTGLYSGGSVYAAQSRFEDSSKEFGNFNGGNFWLIGVGYDFGRQLGVKKALLRADFVYNPPDTQDNATKNFSEIGSLNFQLDAGKWGVSADLAAANGSDGQSDVGGAVVMPWFKFNDKLQLVGRYTYLSSADPNGISFNRYENVAAVNYNPNGTYKTNSFGKVSSQRGDEYNEVYLGLNYYLYGHRLKVQTGWNYTWMSDSANNGGDYSGWGWTTGVRFYF